MLRQSYELRKELEGESGSNALRTGSAYAWVIARRGRIAEGEALLREILRNQQTIEQGTGLNAAYTLGYLVQVVMRGKRYAEAESLALEALGYWRKSAPPANSQRRSIVRLLTSIYDATSQPAKAAALKAEEEAADSPTP